MKSVVLCGLGALAACGELAGSGPPVAGWSVDGPHVSGSDEGNFLRYIVSGPPEAVEEFTTEAINNGWSIEARAESSSQHVFVQFRAPNTIGHLTYFTDKYYAQSPRRINIAPAIAKADVP